MAKRFVHYSGTLADFRALENIADYNSSIVFIKGGADGKGAAIYTHGNFYASVNEALEGLKYLSSVKAGGVTATAQGPNGVIEFSSDDNAAVSVVAGSTGIKIGLTEDFKNSVANNTANIAKNTKAISDEATAREQALTAAKNELSAAINLKATIADLEALEGVVNEINGAYLKASDIAGKLDKSVYDAKMQLLEKADDDNLAAAKSYAEGQAANAEQNAKNYADGLKTDIDAAYAAADAATLNSAKGYADGLAKNYDAAGTGAAAAAQALADAKSHVAEVKSGIETDYKAADAKVLSDAKAYADSIISGEGGVTADVEALKGKVNTLIGEDSGKSARDIVIDEVAKQLTSESISESFDTLKEMAEYLSSHPQSVTGMNQAIEANAAAIEVEKGRVDAIVADYLKAADKTALEGKVTEEASAREQADNALSGRITTIANDYLKAADKEALQGSINSKVDQSAYDTKIAALEKADTDNLASAKSYADNKVGALDVTDAAVAGEYVSSVSQEDGKIKVSRVALPTYSLVEGATNGTVSFNGNEVAVHGLGSAAFMASNAFATAAQGAKADAAAPANTVYTKSDVDAMWAWEEL